MSTTLPVIRGPEKPREFEPCNGCGFCCAAEVCRVGIAVFGNVPAPCPGLRFHDGRFWCWVVEQADALSYGHFLRLTLGIDRGCDAADPTPSLVPMLRRRLSAASAAGAAGEEGGTDA